MNPAIATYVAAAAACLAVGASVLNVVITGRLASRSQLHNWQRDRLYPLCLGVYKASRTYQSSIERLKEEVETRHAGIQAGHEPGPDFGDPGAWEARTQALADITAEVAELELLGPVELARSARQLGDASSVLDRALCHYSVLAEIPEKYHEPEDFTLDDLRREVEDQVASRFEVEVQFLEAARTNIGVRW